MSRTGCNYDVAAYLQNTWLGGLQCKGGQESTFYWSQLLAFRKALEASLSAVAWYVIYLCYLSGALHSAYLGLLSSEPRCNLLYKCFYNILRYKKCIWELIKLVCCMSHSGYYYSELFITISVPQFVPHHSSLCSVTRESKQWTGTQTKFSH